MNRKGFTLIELLIVVVIIGILAAIAIPKFANTKQKAYYASMKSDLRNLVTAEEAFFADSLRYGTKGEINFTPSTGNVLGDITIGGGGWGVKMTSPQNVPNGECAIFIGTTVVAPADKEGEPKCK
jgi:type IV pilus assembly protein PilA